MTPEPGRSRRLRQLAGTTTTVTPPPAISTPRLCGMPPPPQFRYRPIRDGDLPAAIHLIEQDRILYRPQTWSRILDLLRQLLQRARLRGMVVEEIGSGRLRFVGLSGFVLLESLGPVIQGHLSLQELVIEGRCLLPPSRVAKANAARNLDLVALCGCHDLVGLAEPEVYGVHRAAYDAFTSCHRGYGLRAIWQETAVPQIIVVLQGLGMTVVRKRLGGRSYLMRYTAEQADTDPTAALAIFVKFPPPSLRLTKQQQQFLELALLDFADREIEEWLGLSDDALKKRWRSAYARVRRSQPDLLPEGLPGADQRRVLLGYLRQHTEELRPTTRTLIYPGGGNR